MLCQILISRVDIWFISAGVGDACLEVIRDQDFCYAAEKLKGMDMRFDPGM
jgi:hypothetical protein